MTASEECKLWPSPCRPSPATLLTKTLAQVFSCEFCEISKNTFSYRTPPVAASATGTYL